MLEISDIHTYYGESHILHGVSLEVKDDSITCLLGRNGAGKTTLVQSVIGLTPPRQGRISLSGQEITGLPDYQIAKKGVGLVPQGRRIFKRLTVLENLKLGCRDKKALNNRLEEVYSYFPVLRDRSKAGGGQLSGGEQQMLAIARALVSHPRLLLMDEPSEGLAPLMVENIGSIIRKLKGRELSILLVEQNISLAASLAEYIYVLSNGRIVYEGTPQQLADNMHIVEKYLGVRVDN
jgi:branched-chain amino acid transport system ATP-binding protein